MMKRIVFLLFLVPGCTQQTNTGITGNQGEQKRFLSVVGLVYGPVIAIQETVTTPGISFITPIHIDEKRRTVSMASENGEVLARHYFNGKWELTSTALKLDSIVYYATPFAEYFEHYKYRGKDLYDSVNYIIDLEKRKVINPLPYENSTFLFTEDGLLSTWKNEGSVIEKYTYNENGHLVSKKVRDGSSMYEKEVNVYTYDEHKNWITKQTKKYLGPEKKEFLENYSRQITYNK